MITKWQDVDVERRGSKSSIKSFGEFSRSTSNSETDQGALLVEGKLLAGLSMLGTLSLSLLVVLTFISTLTMYILNASSVTSGCKDTNIYMDYTSGNAGSTPYWLSSTGMKQGSHCSGQTEIISER